jgi:hypothetical protein
VLFINPLVAFYDIHEGKREVLFFYFVPDTTRDLKSIYDKMMDLLWTSLIPLRILSIITLGGLDTRY